jgi:hypothetical protein
VVIVVANHLAQLTTTNQGADRGVVPETGMEAKPTTLHLRIRGERNKVVGARRALLRTVLSCGQSPPSTKICERWDFEGITVPEGWAEADLKGWRTAYLNRPGTVQKLISTDISKIPEQSTNR